MFTSPWVYFRSMERRTARILLLLYALATLAFGILGALDSVPWRESAYSRLFAVGCYITGFAGAVEILLAVFPWGPAGKRRLSMAGGLGACLVLFGCLDIAIEVVPGPRSWVPGRFSRTWCPLSPLLLGALLIWGEWSVRKTDRRKGDPMGPIGL